MNHAVMIKWDRGKGLLTALINLVLFCCIISESPHSRAQEAEFGGEVTIAVEAEDTEPVRASKKVRYYLPPELDSPHIVNAGGLTIGKDEADGRFYLYGEFVFDAHEVKSFRVRVKDVWKIPLSKIDEYIMEVNAIQDRLEGTAYEDISGVLCAEARKSAEEIRVSQGKAASVQDHIEIFRKNEQRAEIVWQALDRLRELARSSEDDAVKKISRERIETILLMVTSFLFVITGVSYLVWATGRNGNRGVKK